MRPRALDEVVGQAHLLAPGGPAAPARRGRGGGVGRAARAARHRQDDAGAGSLRRASGNRHFVALSALSSGVKELRAVIDDARRRRDRGQQTVLFVDEVHRFSRTQQDALLGAVEDRLVLLVAATTENPSFSVVAPLLSRSLVLALQPLTDDDVRTLLRRAVADPRGLGGAVVLVPEAEDALVRLAGGDARRALTALEAAADGVAAAGDDAPSRRRRGRAGGHRGGGALRPGRRPALRRDQRVHQVDPRVSDPDAALHYLARMLVAGEDPRFVARRLMVHASEDVGLADPTALPAAVAAAQVVALVGLPEARIALAQVTRAPRDRAEVERGHHGDRRRDGGRAGRRRGPGAAAPARRALRGRAEAGQRGRLPLPARRRGRRRRPSSTRRTGWWAATTTGRRATARSGCWRSGCRSCGGWCGGAPGAGLTAPTRVRRGCAGGLAPVGAAKPPAGSARATAGSRSIGQLMHRGPPRPRPSSPPGISSTSIPCARRWVLVVSLRS